MTVHITAKTTAGAAKATQRALTKLASECGYSGDSLPVYRDKSDDGYSAPTVCWEGLYEWPEILTAGGNMIANDLGWSPWYLTNGEERNPEIALEPGEWFAEAVNGCQLAFYKY